MKIFQTLILFIVWVMISSSAPVHRSEKGYTVVKRMFETTASIQSLTYTMHKQERIKGEMIEQRSFTKMEKEPFKIYLRQSYPKDGMEVLFVTGRNNDKALVNPNGFPWVNLKLDPMEWIMRNNQHHTIFQSGFDHVISILEFLCEKYTGQLDDMVRLEPSVMLNGVDCYAVIFDNPYFQFEDYTVEDNESIEDIAARYKLSPHMILENNANIKDFDDVVAGQIIQIPNDYSPRMELFIDKSLMVPVSMVVYDDKGLYEQYDYADVTINPAFDPAEFSKDYKDYDF